MPRFFAATTLGPDQLGLTTEHTAGDVIMTPRVVEYLPGDMFDISQSPYTEDLEWMASWDDATLTEYLRLHVDPLKELVVKAAAE